MKKMVFGIFLFFSLFLVIGCGGGGGSSSSASTSAPPPPAPISEPPTPPVTKITQNLFTLNLTDQDGKPIKNMSSYKVTINNQVPEKTLKKDNTLTLKLDNELQENDVVDVEIGGYTPQQFKITKDMLETHSANVALKPIESRQTYSLADLINNEESVAPQSMRGAKTVIENNNVKFKLNNGKVEISIPISSYKRIVRKIARLPKSTTDTKVYLDMTSIDPKLEFNATIGDFSYEPADRTTNEVDDSNGLESVTMADIRMTTSEGDEIHCFGGGNYDPNTGKCDDNTYATLKMKIPASQFKEYAEKYNGGDRVVPLYYYNKTKATWVRQTDENGNPIDGSLVLVDNNNNNIADEGDELYIEGKVNHFSWWNGDYPMEVTCLNVPVDTKGSDAVSKVTVSGVDYVGRVFTKYIDKDTTSVTINAKKNAIVRVSLIMKNGGVADSFVYKTGDSEECVDVNRTLVADTNLTKGQLNVKVVNKEGNPLDDCYVNFTLNNEFIDSEYVDETGSAEFSYFYNPDLKIDLNASVSVSCYENNFYFNDEKNIILKGDDSLTFVFDTALNTYTGKVYEVINGVKTPVKDAYVKIYRYSPNYLFNYDFTDINGSFTIPLLKSKVDASTEAYIYISFYDENYAKYISMYKKIDLSNLDLGEFDLSYVVSNIKGRVTDTLGNPISGAKVYVYNSETSAYATADNNGYYNLKLLSSSDDINTTIYAYVYKGRYLYSESKTFLTKPDVTENLEIDLRKAIIKGRLLTKEGLPLSNVIIYWSGDWWSNTTTDENGSFEIDTYNEGDGYLSAYYKDNYDTVDLNDSIYSRYYYLTNVKKGEITDLGNIIVDNDNYPPTISDVVFNPKYPKVSTNFDIIVNATDPDGDELYYSLENPYSENITITQDSQNPNVFHLSTDDVGYYYLRVSVSDGKNKVNRYISFYVQQHTKPVIRSVSYTFPNGKYYYDRSQDVNITVDAYSEEGNALSYDFNLYNYTTGDEYTLTHNKNVAVLPTSITNGYYKLTITVSDAFNKVKTYRYFTVDNTVAPEIDKFLLNNQNTTAIYIRKSEGSSTTLNIYASIKNADKVENPKWYLYINGKTFTSNSSEINETVTFENSGTYYGYVSVRDDRYRSDYKYFTVTVEDNLKPVINQINVTPSKVVYDNGEYIDENNKKITEINVSIEAFDPDGDNLTYTFGQLNGNDPISTGNSWAVYSIDGLEVGKYAIKINVSDGQNEVSDYGYFEVQKNEAPIITQMYVPVKGKAGEEIELFASAYDPNGDTITYKWSVDRGTLTNENSSEPTLTLPEDGNVTVTLTVSDGDNSVSKTAVIEVEANQPPIIKYFEVETPVVNDGKLKLKAYFADVDGYVESAVYKINDLTYPAEYGETEIDVSNLEEGNYTVELIVTDDNNASVTKFQSFEIKVNHAPEILNVNVTPAGNILVGEEAKITVSAADPDGDSFTIKWSCPNGNLMVDTEKPDNATFSADEPGTYEIKVWAVDEKGLSSSVKTITIVVTTAVIKVDITPSSITVGDDVTLKAQFVDSEDNTLDYDAISWTLTNKPDGSNVTVSSDTDSVTFKPDVAGLYTVEVTITRNGKTYKKSVTLNVQNESEGNVVEGTVTDTEGNILQGALVRLYNKEDASIYDEQTTTDSNGYYKFENVPSGTYYLVVYAGDGYIKQTKVITIQ